MRDVKASSAPLRPVRLGPPDVLLERKADGTLYLRSPHKLDSYPEKLTQRLEHWADVAPDRVFLAQRAADGSWRKLTYAQALTRVRAIAQALLGRKLAPERPIVILSGNDLEHAMLGLAAMMIGVPYAPISVPYSLMSHDFGKLKSIMETLTPGLVLPRAARRSRAHRGRRAARTSSSCVTADRRRAADHVVRRHCSRRSQPPRSTSPTPRSVPIRSRNSCSPRARPAIPRASSTPSACCVQTRR